jgi:hypothetical protein
MLARIWFFFFGSKSAQTLGRSAPRSAGIDVHPLVPMSVGISVRNASGIDAIVRRLVAGIGVHPLGLTSIDAKPVRLASGIDAKPVRLVAGIGVHPVCLAGIDAQPVRLPAGLDAL